MNHKGIAQLQRNERDDRQAERVTYLAVRKDGQLRPAVALIDLETFKVIQRTKQKEISVRFLDRSWHAYTNELPVVELTEIEASDSSAENVMRQCEKCFLLVRYGGKTRFAVAAFSENAVHDRSVQNGLGKLPVRLLDGDLTETTVDVQVAGDDIEIVSSDDWPLRPTWGKLVVDTIEMRCLLCGQIRVDKKWRVALPDEITASTKVSQGYCPKCAKATEADLATVLRTGKAISDKPTET